MDFSDTILVVGEQQFTIAQVAAAVAVLSLVLLATIVTIVWRASSARKIEVSEARRRTTELEGRLAELSGQLRNFSDMAASREAQMARNLDARLDSVGHRLGEGLTQSAERTSKSLQHLYERLAVIDTAQQKITDLSSEMLTLKDILSNKQARGAYGQARMEAIVRDGLHGDAYSFQATLSNKKRPDCLVKLPESELQIVIDAKFPLEAFNALKSAESEPEVVSAERQLRRDIQVHVRDISEKYLIAGETHQTAIMFVPAESIYVELHDKFEDIIQKAHRQRVIIASPNILMLLVKTLQAIFRDSRMREQAALIQKEVVYLLEDIGRLQSRLDKLKSHFQMTSKDIDDLAVSARKITRRGEKIEQLELAEEADEQISGETKDKPRLVASGNG